MLRGMWSRGWAVSLKYSVPAIKPSLLISVSWLHLGKATLYSGKMDLGLVSAGSNGLEPNGWFLQIRTKYKGDNLCCMFHSVCCVLHAKLCRLSRREESSVLLTIYYLTINEWGSVSYEELWRSRGCYPPASSVKKMSRNEEVSPEEIKRIVDNATPINTKRSTKYGLKIFIGKCVLNAIKYL